MKTQSQIVMIALVTLFTMALSLAVALICISHLKRQDEPVPQTTSDTLPVPTDDSVTPSDTDSSTDEPNETEAPCSELRFSSNGDGTCAVSGIGDCTDSCVVIPTFSPSGDRVTAIAPLAFYGLEGITAVQIPVSVMEIGALALSNCPNLVYISVDSQNLFFCDADGILYSKDSSLLIVYPPMRSGSELLISAATDRIADMAFYNCAHLSRIRYAGSAEQWESIRIGRKNYSLTAASKEFLNQA